MRGFVRLVDADNLPEMGFRLDAWNNGVGGGEHALAISVKEQAFGLVAGPTFGRAELLEELRG